ncbi:hypothetical protein GOBAR_AA37917 [Gossypium barbadense]|uniref:Uncharacterized protein n=1 Tax=Gossypium barbadense TaxID=3634 RepID=A0A2P5VVE0_GOSBA|nr:hypothetical protein GOBAR_AA37917 [Gossypium barbadense]
MASQKMKGKHSEKMKGIKVAVELTGIFRGKKGERRPQTMKSIQAKNDIVSLRNPYFQKTYFMIHDFMRRLFGGELPRST